jgi:hypothetical protein
VDEEAIPQSILKLDRAMDQLGCYQKSDVTSKLIELTAGFQSIASDNNLGHPRTQNSSLQKAVLSRFKKPVPGLSKGKTLMVEMKAAKDDAGRIKITAGLYLISKNKSGTELMKKVMLSKSRKVCQMPETVRQVPQVYFSLKFDESTPIYNALGNVLVDTQEFHRKSFPLAKPIQRFVLFVVTNPITM